MKTMIALLTLISANAFASGSPVVYCTDMSPGSRMQYYFGLNGSDESEDVDFYPVSTYGMIQEVTDNAGRTEDVLELNAQSEDTDGGYHFKKEDKDTDPNAVTQWLDISFRTKNGTKIKINAGNKGITNKKKHTMTGTATITYAKKDQPKDRTLENVTNARVKCSYDWE